MTISIGINNTGTIQIGIPGTSVTTDGQAVITAEAQSASVFLNDIVEYPVWSGWAVTSQSSEITLTGTTSAGFGSIIAVSQSAEVTLTGYVLGAPGTIIAVSQSAEITLSGSVKVPFRWIDIEPTSQIWSDI